MTSSNEARLRAVPLFADCTDAELSKIASLVDEQRLDAGSVIVPNGMPEGTWFVVLEGRARTRSGDREIGELRPGDAIGDITMVDGRPVRATVEAVTEVRLLSTPGAHLRELFTIGSIAAVALRDLAAPSDQS